MELKSAIPTELRTPAQHSVPKVGSVPNRQYSPGLHADGTTLKSLS